MSRNFKLVSLALTGVVVAGFMYLQQPGVPENSADTAAVPENTVQEETEDVVEEAGKSDEPSPFEVVESEVPAVVEPETAAAEVQIEVQAPPSDDAPAATAQVDSQESSTTVTAVPSSYSIEDAEKYFVPKELRGPGNIGGPPPLNFPGGPNDKSLQSDEG